MQTVGLIIPCYNKEQDIAGCIRGLQEEASKTGFGLEILVVDDGSTDGSAQIVAADDTEGVRLLSLGQNFGKGAAIRAGFAGFGSATDYLGYFDADLDIHSGVLSALFEQLSSNPEVAGVYGSKRHPESTVEIVFWRRAGSALYSVLSRVIAGAPQRDTQTGAKLFVSAVGKEVVGSCLINGFAFDVELLARCNSRRYHLLEVPVQIRSQSTSSVSPRRILQALLELFAVRRALGQSGRSLQIL